MKLLQQITRGLNDIAFPTVCMSCGDVIELRHRILCPVCLQSRFEDPNPSQKKSCGDAIMPDSFVFQDALWRYDKDGILQEMIRLLKYQGMSGIGYEAGLMAGHRIARRHLGKSMPPDPDESVLVPVPLHYLKRKKRGYNQAWVIAAGMKDVSKVPIASVGAVIRNKNTLSQTRFSFTERMINLERVFEVRKPEELKDRFAVIVDDVFTTGSTAFSLGKVLKNAGVQKMGVMTVCLA